MKKYRILPFIILMLLISLVPGSPAVQAQNQVIRIGVTFDGPWDRNDEMISLLRKELKEALSSQAEVEVRDSKILTGNWTLSSVAELNNKLLNDREVDYVIGMGVLSSQDLAKRKSFSKPVIAPVVIDPVYQDISFQSGISGVKNLCYLVFPSTFENDIKAFREIARFKKLVIIAGKKYWTNLTPGQNYDKMIGEKIGAEVQTIYYDESAEEVISAIPKDAGAVYFNFFPVNQPELQKIVKEINKRRLPSFSSMGEYQVRRGVMASLSSDLFPRIVRRIALNIQRISLGDDPGTLSVTFSASKKMFINLGTVYTIGVSPKWNTLLEAELVNITTAEMPDSNSFSLKSALLRISEQNLDLQAKMQEVNAEFEKVNIARSNFLPRIDLSASGTQIDEDRANAGSQPVRSGSLDLSLRQLIYSEQAYANMSIQNSLIDSKRNEQEVLRLNTMLEGAKVYINCLRVEKLLLILLDNLKLMRENYSIAEIRQSTGSAGPEEKLRWEAEIANMRKTAMEVQSQFNQVLMVLKQTMNFPLIYLLNIKDITIDDPDLIISNVKFRDYLEDPVSFDILTDFLVQEGINNSKEIAQLNSLIGAQERNLTSINRSFYLPTVSAFANFSNIFYKSKVNSLFSLTSMPALPASIPVEFPVYMGELLSAAAPRLPDNFNWNAGIQFSFNITDGFSTSASREKAKAEMNQLEYQKKAAVDKVAMRVRYEMENVKSAYFGIQQSKIEHNAAQKALKITTDGYSRGALSILSLIDAQSSALRADQVSVNAQYDLLSCYMQLQRATGKYDILMSNEERAEAIGRFTRFMEGARNQR
ncbi:MAG: ABC transporter substrate binding protein [Syntrophothermus sp.]